MSEPAQRAPSKGATAIAGGNWWPVAAMAFGVAHVLLAVPPAFRAGPPDSTPAIALLVLGVAFMGLAVALAVDELVRRVFSHAISATLAGAASIPVLASIFLPIGFDVGPSALFVFAVGLAAFLLRPSAAFAVFLLLSAIPQAGYLFLMNFANGVGI